MDARTKKLVAIILLMLKDVYDKTSKLETMFQSSSIHIMSRSFDPFAEMLKTLQIPNEQQALLYNLMKHYVEEQMTIDEILIAMDNQLKSIQAM